MEHARPLTRVNDLDHRSLAACPRRHGTAASSVLSLGTCIPGVGVGSGYVVVDRAATAFHAFGRYPRLSHMLTTVRGS